MTTPTQQKAADTLAPGYHLGEYLIEEVLGQGGFGITYRAQDTRLGARVAIKEYFPQSYSARDAHSTIIPRTGADLENYRWGLAEFLKEARALAKFKHPHIVRVLRYLETNGTAYMVMEYEEGETLASYLRNHGGQLDEPRLLRIFLQVLGGLQAVHDLGLLHLDIKPDNIYLRANQEPMLIDFGSARQTRGDGGTQKIMLTPGYCALEQYPGHGDIGAWSDVYSVGATLYRCITGQMPIDSLERQDKFARSHIDPLRPATSFERPFYSAEIRRCIDAALNLSSADRPVSAFALQQGLMGKDMTRAERRGSPAGFRPGAGYIGVVPTAMKDKKRRVRRGPIETAVAVLVFLLTFAIVIPKSYIDTGHMTEQQLFDWIDDQKAAAVANVTDFGVFINEKIFGERRRVQPVPEKRARAPQPKPVEPDTAPAPAVAEVLTPYSVGKQKILEISLAEHPPRALGFLKHGTILAIASEDGLVRLWDLQSGEARQIVPTRVRSAAALGVFPSSQWFAASDREDAIVIFDPLGNREYVLRDDLPYPIKALVASANGRLLAAADEGKNIVIWDPFQNRRLHRITTSERVEVLAFSPDEKLLVVGGKNGLSLFDTATGKLVTQRRAHERGVSALAFSPDGRWLASGGAGGELRIWSMGEESRLEPLTSAPATVHGLAFSPDSRWLLAIGTDKAVSVWNVLTREYAQYWAAHKNHIIALAVSADGKRLATAGDDRIVRLWE